MPDVFISYSREDQATARRFADAFTREGFDVWWDQTLDPGDAYDRVTEKALKESRAVVVLWSRHSVESHWVRAEATQARNNKTLVPVMIEACERPIMFELTHTADLAHWKGEPRDEAWQAYVSSLRRFVRKELPAAPPPVQPIAARPQRMGPMAITIAVAALAIAGVVLWALNRPPPAVVNAQASAVIAPTAAGVTLAVLPFANLSSDPEQEYFSDGLTEEILNQLVQVKGLVVTGRTSSFSFKGKNEDLRVIAETLGVANLLEGSIRKDGAQLRITAQLIEGKSGAHLWSKTYARELKDVFSLQEEIAKDVAKALSIKLDVSTLPSAQGGTTNIDAYDKYLQAQAILRQGFLSARVVQASQLLQEAVALDPKFVSAWVILAGTQRASRLWQPERAEALLQEATENDSRAVALAPDSLIARHIRLGQSLAQRKWFAAEAEAAIPAEMEAATATFYSPEGNQFQNRFLVAVGRFDEAITHIERSRQQDPLNLSISMSLQLNLDAAGRVAEAQAEYERSRDLSGDHNQANFFALLRLMARADADPATVKAMFREALEHAPLEMDPGLTDKINDRDVARAMIRKAFEHPANQEALRMTIVAFYAGAFGDRDLALAALRRSQLELGGNPLSTWLAYQPDLRSDARFKELLRDMGLVDYFRASGNWGDFCKPVGKDDFECR